MAVYDSSPAMQRTNCGNRILSCFSQSTVDCCVSFFISISVEMEHPTILGSTSPLVESPHCEVSSGGGRRHRVGEALPMGGYLRMNWVDLRIVVACDNNM